MDRFSLLGCLVTALTLLSDWSWQSFRSIENLSVKSHIWPITTTAPSSGFYACLAGYAAAPHGGYNLQLLVCFYDLEKCLSSDVRGLMCAVKSSLLTTQECISTITYHFNALCSGIVSR